MDLVVDIGGVFIYSSNPGQLAEWYRKHLGIEWTHNETEGCYYRDFLHRDYESSRVTRTAWAIFPRKIDLSPPAPSCRINYRVANLGKVIDHLKAGGVQVEKVEEYDYGLFAWIRDPDGNSIELFQEKLL